MSTRIEPIVRAFGTRPTVLHTIGSYRSRGDSRRGTCVRAARNAYIYMYSYIRVKRRRVFANTVYITIREPIVPYNERKLTSDLKTKKENLRTSFTVK